VNRSEDAMFGRTKKLTSIARLTATLALVVGPCQCATRPASADDQGWMFRHSYFSHVLPPEIQARYPVPESRSAYRRPIVNLAPGYGVRGVYRYNPIEIFDGRSTDVEIYRQFWFQTEP
jgi:hypothetical protein